MEKIQKMSRYYTATLKTICGADYDKVQAASLAIAEEQDGYGDDYFGGLYDAKTTSESTKPKITKPL